MIREGSPESKDIKVKGPVEDPCPRLCFLYFCSSSLPGIVKLRDGEERVVGERGLGKGCFVNDLYHVVSFRRELSSGKGDTGVQDRLTSLGTCTLSGWRFCRGPSV